MISVIRILFTLVITSFFFFPFVFTFLPGINTKMILAACGLATFCVNQVLHGRGKVSTDFFMLSSLALGVSFASYLSMTLNNTPDDSYLSYIVSMWVWLGAAYFVVTLIKAVHGRVSVELICFYLIAVGVLQCLLAVTIDAVPSVKQFVDSILAGEGFMGKNKDRLYGLGCALDVAGGRFAVLLIMIAYLLPRMLHRERCNFYVALLLLAFGVISIIGNIIGRTTTIGMVGAILYLLYVMLTDSVLTSADRKRFGSWVIGTAVTAVLVSVLLYKTNAQWHSYFDFGFEGFISLAEKGRWEVHSNEMLRSQYVLPDSFRTWIIGDGYCASTDIDPYYIGQSWHGFYKGTDIGYSRFLFYFGLTGLILFSLFMIKAAGICMRRFRAYRFMFFCILILNFIIWGKVSTDIFLVFAPFLVLSREEEAGSGDLLDM